MRPINRKMFSWAIALPLVTLLVAGCTTFEPPRFEGKISKIEEPIELPFEPAGDYAFSENSLTTINSTVNFGRMFTMYGKAEVRSSAAGHVSIRPAGKGYVMTLNLSKLSVQPIGQGGSKTEGGFAVDNLGYTGFLDHAGKIVEFDVDRNSEGWSALDMEQKQLIEAELKQWKRRRNREPVLPRLVTGAESIEIDAADFAPDSDGNLVADFKMSGKTVFQFAGITLHRDERHLVLNFHGNIEGASKTDKVTMTGEVGGYALINVNSGDSTYWKYEVSVKVVKFPATLVIRESTEGELTLR